MAKMKKDEQQWITPAGTVITQEVAEELAEEAERGYDLEHLERRFVGRPSLGQSGVSPRVSFRAPSDLYDAAWKRADKEGRSLSDLAREALERYLGL
nr:ribbon-helix-helix domain-containing protein [Solirubrobacterales bacterium]